MDNLSIGGGSNSGTGSSEGDFLAEYRAISSKLKKRFLRRPNVAEANDLFGRLARRLKSEEEPQYEALCHLAVARCEQSVSNHSAEAEALIAASRSFLEAEMKTQSVGCPSYEEHLLAAIHSYNQAVRILEDGKQMSRASGLCLELADALYQLDKPGEALSFYQRAADLRSSTILEYIHAREKVATCYIDTGDYHNALTVLTEIACMAEEYGGRPVLSVYADILRRCEILRIFLLLLIEPTNQNISPSLTTILEKYAWESEDTTVVEETLQYLSEELFLLLQSIVMAVQIRDNHAVMELEDHLAPLLSTQPRTLLRKLVKNMHDKAPGLA